VLLCVYSILLNGPPMLACWQMHADTGIHPLPVVLRCLLSAGIHRLAVRGHDQQAERKQQGQMVQQQRQLQVQLQTNSGTSRTSLTQSRCGYAAWHMLAHHDVLTRCGIP
jgi:hypothetical protein